MIEQKLLLLGLLKEKPRHGYQIKKKIQEILSIFAGIEVKSIYYPLRILEKEGLVIKRIKKFGRRPQCFVYELTGRGQEHFKMLLTQSLLDFRRPQFSLDLSLYFLHYLPSATARLRLRARMRILKKIIRDLKSMIRNSEKTSSASLVYILEHNLHMVESELKFLSNFIKTI